MGDEISQGVASQETPVSSSVARPVVVKKQRSYGFLLLIGIIFVIVVVGVVVFVILDGRGEGGGVNERDYGELGRLYKLSPEGEGSIGDLEGEEELLEFLEVVEDLSLAEKIELCLGGGTMGVECKNLFKERGIGEACEGLGEMKDECFLNVAVINNDESACNEISDEEMKEVCEFEFSLELPIA